MPTYQLLRCEIALGGDKGNTVVRGRFNPLTFPELMLMHLMHGEDAVWDVHVVGTCDMSNEEMGQRLRVLYDEDYLKEMFPGARPRYPTQDASLPICTQPVYKPRPTRPDSPDPVLKPLVANMYPVAEVAAPAAADELDSMLSADDIAAHRDDRQEDDDVPLDQLILGGPQNNPPTVDDLVTMPHVKAPGAHLPRQMDHLPDVATPVYTQPGNVQRAATKGRGASR